jgi:hypothetical protein
MTLKTLLESIPYLAQTAKEGVESDIAVDHDVIYAGGPVEADADTASELERLGWSYEEGFRCWSAFA